MSSRLYYRHTAASLAARRDFDHDAYYDQDNNNNKELNNTNNHYDKKKNGGSKSSSPRGSPSTTTTTTLACAVADNRNYVSKEASNKLHTQQKRTPRSLHIDDDRTACNLPSLPYNNKHHNYKSPRALSSSPRHLQFTSSSSSSSPRHHYSNSTSLTTDNNNNTRSTNRSSNSSTPRIDSIRIIEEERAIATVNNKDDDDDDDTAASNHRTSQEKEEMHHQAAAQEQELLLQQARAMKEQEDKELLEAQALKAVAKLAAQQAKGEAEAGEQAKQTAQQWAKQEHLAAQESHRLSVEADAMAEQEAVGHFKEEANFLVGHEALVQAKQKRGLEAAERVEEDETKQDDDPHNVAADKEFETKLKQALVGTILPTQNDVQTLFDEMDENQDGFLSLREVEHAIFQRKNATFHLKPTVVLRAFEKADDDGDGLITREEFYMLLCMMTYFQNLYRIFSLIDTNHDRHLSQEEFFNAASILRVPNPEDVWRGMDSSGNNQVCFDEFCLWMAGK